ncbi:MAG TPA: hypothetical protein DEA94_09695 [Rhodobacteraceae bacterium]|nr:hypothetical protein [Paracoccaceae bacterium]|tara:strand:+ start:1047 stop:1553 length:507 start_codon:yes stop_codon:yes gene_type:complete
MGLRSKLSRWLLLVNQGALIGIGIAMVGIVIYQIIARTGGFSVRWTGELARFLSIWATFLAVPVLLMHQRLISIDYFHMLMPMKVRRMLTVIQILAVVGGSLALIWIGWKQVGVTWNQTSPGLLWPMGLFTLPIVVSSVMSLIILPDWGRDAFSDAENEDGVGTEKFL